MHNITAGGLYKNVNNKDINMQITAAKNNINELIQTRHLQGGNQVKYTLPTIDSKTMSTDDANLIFVTELIRIFVEREFIVSIRQDGLKSIMVIEWKSGLTEEERKNRRQLLERYKK